MKKIFLTLTASIACVVSIYAYSPDPSAASAAAPVKPKTDSNVTGHAVDAVTGEHLAHVTISVKGTTIGAITDRTGHFFLKNLPLGEYVLVASYVGYENEEQEIVFKGGKTKEVNFNLKPATVHMNQIVVSASRNAENRAESPVIVNVLSAELFDNTSSCTLADALDYQSGLRVEYNCSNCGFPQLRINGLQGQYSQILLDSRPLFSSLAGVYGLEQLPTGMIDRVEVIRGGGSAMYGSNAVAGVVNIITKEPVRNSIMLSNMTSLMDGKSVDLNTVLNGSFVSDDYRAGVYIFGMVRDRDHYDRNGDGFSDLPKLNSETIGFRGYYKTSNYSKLTAEFHHIREYRRGGNKLKYPAHKADITEQLRHGINGGGLNFDIFSKNYRHKANLYVDFQRIERNSYFGGGGNLDAYGLTNDDTFIVGGQYLYKMNKCLFMPAEISAGVEYTDNYLHDEMLGYGRDLKQTSRVIGGYIQNEWKNKKISFAIGARLDKHNKIDDPVFSPRVNLRYTPIENIILRAGYSSGYRAPQAYDEELHVGAVGDGHVTMIKMAKNLKTEYSNSFTASADLYKTWGKWQANLLLEGFYTKLDHVFALKDLSREPVDPSDPDGPAIIWKERFNESGAKVWGVNIEGRLSYSNKGYLQMGYTVQRSRYKDPHEELEEVEPIRRMLRAPNNYGFMALGYTPCKSTQIVVNGVYTGSMLVPHERPDAKENSIVKTKDFWDMGFKLSYDFKLGGMVTLQLNAGMKNVFDQFQKDLDYGKDKDAGYIYGPSIPRTYFFGIKFMM